LVLAVIALMVAGGCGGGGSGGGGGRRSTAGQPAAVPGFDPARREIHVGAITPLTGPVAVIGKPLTVGNEVWFRHVNDDLGGIGGRYKVVLDERDSQYVPQTAVQQYNDLKGRVAMVAQLFGTAVTKAVLPLLDQDGMVAAPASLDADWVRQRYLLAVGAPYQVQMINAADYVVHEEGGRGRTFCSLIQDDAYGEAGQHGVDFAARQLGFAVAATARFRSGNPDFTAQVQQLHTAGCQVVFLVSTPSDTSRALGTAAQLEFAPRWVGQSPSWSGAFATSPLKDYLAAHFLLVGEGTEWGDRSVKGMADMVERLHRFRPDQPPDYYFIFGYYQAWAVTQVLERAVAAGDLSRAGILRAMEQAGILRFDGLSGDYRYGPAATRDPPRENTIFRVDPTRPVGLATVKLNFASEAARRYVFGAP
jgi:ABC-type branched-subunit amino acid transport system substrate-binding protein